MSSLYYSMCALQVLRAYADACESGASFCHLSQRDTTIESE